MPRIRKATKTNAELAEHWARMLGAKWSPFAGLPNKPFVLPEWMTEKMLHTARRYAWVRMEPDAKFILMPRGRALRDALRARRYYRATFSDSPYERRKNG